MRKSTEMLVNMKPEDIPVWNPKKNYYDQHRLTLQFWQNEARKIRKGIKIGPWKMHPWLYFHLNIFKTPVPRPTKEGGVADKIMNPPFTDNDLLVADSLSDAQARNRTLALFGTRGFFKSTYIASYTQYTILNTQGGGTFKIIGGSDSDLKDIARMLQTTFENVTPAFYLPTLKKEWEHHVIFGVKDKSTSGRAYIHANILTINADDTKKKSDEKGAGGSPIGLVIDEVGKFEFTKVFNSALPSFRTPHGYRFVPILSGTSGSIELAKPARMVLENPEAWEVLPFNYKRLCKGVPDEEITWKNDINKKFGTFVPGQMSGRHGIPKIRKKLSEFLEIKNEHLDQVSINVTDWKRATPEIKRLHRLGNTSGKEDDKKNQMYYPLEIDDIFQTVGHNPFPIPQIKRRIKYLEEEGGTAKPVELYKENGKIGYDYSTKERAKIEHPGGVADAPAFLYGDFPEVTPEKYFFIGGLDDYKSNIALNTDSLGSFYILQRRNLALNTPCEKIVFSYSSRPQRHEDFHDQCQFGLEAFGAECLMEAADTTFIDHLKRQRLDWKHLTPGLTFAPSQSKNSSKPIANEYGLFPTKWNNEFRMKRYVDWCHEKHTVGIDETGNPIIKLSVEFIDDIELLKEMEGYKPGKNVDRIAAHSHAVLRCVLLDEANILPKQLAKQSMFSTKPLDERPRIKRNSNPYGIQTKGKRGWF